MFKQIKSEMVKFPIAVSKDTSTDQAINIMEDVKIRHLPVLDNDVLVGVVSQRDLLEGLSKSAKIEDVMTADPFVAHRDEDLKEVVEVMAHNKFGSVLIVNDDNLLEGIFTTTDALKLLAKFLGSEVQYDKVPVSLLSFSRVVGF